MKHRSPTVQITGSKSSMKKSYPSGDKNPKKMRTNDYTPPKMGKM